MPLDATPKGPNANSYVDAAEANTILTTEWLNTAGWTSANSGSREAALIMATTLIDLSFEFDGAPTTVEQALRCPRSGMVNMDGEHVDHNTVPAILKKATAVFALSLLTSNRVADPALVGLGLSSASLGPMSVTIDPSQVKDMVPADVRLLLAPIADPVGPASGSSMRTVKLERS